MANSSVCKVDAPFLILLLYTYSLQVNTDPTSPDCWLTEPSVKIAAMWLTGKRPLFLFFIFHPGSGEIVYEQRALAYGSGSKTKETGNGYHGGHGLKCLCWPSTPLVSIMGNRSSVSIELQISLCHLGLGLGGVWEWICYLQLVMKRGTLWVEIFCFILVLRGTWLDSKWS